MGMDLFDLTGKVALISGAGSIGGQGEAQARLFAEHGARVVLADLPGTSGAEIARSIGDQAMFVELDVTDEDSWSQAMARVKDRWSAPNILSNTAGVWLMKGILETSHEEYMQVVGVNQVGVYLGMAAVLPDMKAMGGGTIVNLCSVSGMKGGGQPFAYAASKWAVRGMTHQVAHELAEFNIRVNAISPGVVDTPMIHGGQEVLTRLASLIPSKRVAQPLEIASIALFLVSDASSYVSGTEVVADAGLTA